MHARIQQIVNACSAHDNVDDAVTELNRGYLDLFRELRADVASQLSNTSSFDRTILALEEMAGELLESVAGIAPVCDSEPSKVVTVFTGGPFPDLETWVKHGFLEADYEEAKAHYESEHTEPSLSEAPPPASEPPTMLFDPSVEPRMLEPKAPAPTPSAPVEPTPSAPTEPEHEATTEPSLEAAAPTEPESPAPTAATEPEPAQQ